MSFKSREKKRRRKIAQANARGNHFGRGPGRQNAVPKGRRSRHENEPNAEREAKRRDPW